MLLRIKLLLFAGLCAVVPILLSTFWSARIAADAIEAELRQKSQEIFEQANAVTQNKADALVSYNFLILSNPGLPLALGKRNWSMVAHVAESTQKGLKLDILEVLDGSGALAYSSESTADGPGHNPADFIQKLFDENRFGGRVGAVGVEFRPKGVAIEVASALPRISAAPPGSVLMGFYLNNDYFRQLKQVMNADFCLLSKGQVLAGTFAEGERGNAEWLAQAQGEGPGSAVKVEIQDKPYFLTLKKLHLKSVDLDLAVFVHSEKAEAARRRSILFIALAGAIGLVVGLGLAVALSRRLMTPIESLTQAVDKIGKGDFNVNVEVSSRDEIGFLAYTFNAMLSQLKEAQEKLIRTEKLAAIGQLASGVGHELRNPLAAIKNAIYFVRNALKKAGQPENDPVSQMLEIAESEIAVTVKIANDLLEFSRAIRVSPEKADLHEVLGSALNVIQFPPKVQLKKKFAEKLPPVFVDPERMRQVFINLINNAVEAMPEGGNLEIETCYNEGAVQLAVRDTGSGIPEEIQEKIFEPLFSTKSKGTGLGLAIVRGIVDSHRGQLALKSEVGKGAEFTIRIPTANDNGGA